MHYVFMLFNNVLPFVSHCLHPGTVVRVRNTAARTHLISVHPMLYQLFVQNSFF